MSVGSEKVAIVIVCFLVGAFIHRSLERVDLASAEGNGQALKRLPVGSRQIEGCPLKKRICSAEFFGSFAKLIGNEFLELYCLSVRKENVII